MLRFLALNTGARRDFVPFRQPPPPHPLFSLRSQTATSQLAGFRNNLYDYICDFIYIYIHIICKCMTIDIPRYIMKLTCVMMYGYIKYLYLNGFINKLTAGGAHVVERHQLPPSVVIFQAPARSGFILSIYLI